MPKDIFLYISNITIGVMKMKHSIALIGCGRISFKHIESYVNNKEKLNLVAVCDPVLERAEAKKTEYEKSIKSANVKVYADYNQMLSELKPEIITIATESGKHRNIAIDCLNAGACNMRKPMALSTKDAQDMIDAAKRIIKDCSLFSK